MFCYTGRRQPFQLAAAFNVEELSQFGVALALLEFLLTCWAYMTKVTVVFKLQVKYGLDKAIADL